MPRLPARKSRCVLAAALTVGSIVRPLAALPAHAAGRDCPTAIATTAVSCTFGFTGGEQTFTVPAGVTSVRITTVGAPGASTATGSGGMGATVTATVPLPTGTTTLYVEVGGKDAVNADNFNGGGQGGRLGGSGGGASDVRTCSMSACTAFSPAGPSGCQPRLSQGVPDSACSPDPRLVVAGGGGGAGTDVAGGSAGNASVTGPGDGGRTQGDVPAVPGHDGGFGGTAGGFYNAPMFDGWGGAMCRTAALQLLNGQLVPTRSISCISAALTMGSGSGGGGYYGGGAGVGFAPGWPKDGGGGGSSYWVPDATDTAMATDSTGTPSVTVTALNAPQSIQFTSTPPAAATVGGSYPVSAEASSGLPVALSVGPASTPGACTIAGTTVAFAAAGTCVVDADQAGDAYFAPAPQVTQTIAIGPATPTITWPDPPDIDYGTVLGSGQLDATASVPGTFRYAPPVGTLLDVGTHLLGTEFTPSDAIDYTSASASASITVVPAATGIIVSAAPDPARYGDDITLSATVSGAADAVGALPPGGTITFTVDGQDIGGPVPLTGDRAGSDPISGLGAGTHTITASYSGDARYLPSTDAERFTIDRAAQTITFTSTPPADPTEGGSYVARAEASSGLPVVLSIDSGSTPGACALSGDTVTFTGAGTCLVDADQAGDANYGPAATAVQSITVRGAPATPPSSGDSSSTSNPSTPANPSGSSGPSGPAPRSGAGTPSGGSLAGTGIRTTGVLLLATLLLVTGAGLLVGSQRRRRRPDLFGRHRA
jgi:hypothetical protein